jgi:hypothetical protein
MAGVTIELEQDGPHMFRFETDDDAKLQLRLHGCERDGMAYTYATGSILYPEVDDPADYLLLDLKAGQYVLRLIRKEVTTPLTVTISVAPWP